MIAHPTMLKRRVLIFHSGALGDFVLTWPLALALARLYPQSRIIYVTQRSKGELAEKVLRVEFDDVEHGWHHLFGDPDNLPDSCRHLLNSSHAIYSFVSGPNDPWMKAVSQIAPWTNPLALAINPNGPGHAIVGLLDSLAPQPAAQTAVRQILASIADHGVGGKRSPDPNRFIIHPGSGSPQKCWPLENYLKVAEHLKNAGRKVRIIIGEVELERWPRHVLDQLADAAEVARSATYLDLLAELSLAENFLGNDSGPGHLAGILGLKTLILYGPTDPAIWKPLGPRVRTLRREPISEIAINDVIASLAE
ncbi:MAG: glycosyltransferase family 9 protein [Tepidisphaeraceae bacterium]|jgi:ADP-heptose:LPS heptosyltransferase